MNSNITTPSHINNPITSSLISINKQNHLDLEKDKPCSLLNENNDIEFRPQRNPFVKLDQELNRIKQQLKRKDKLIETCSLDSKTTKNFLDILSFKRKKGLLHMDNQEKFKDNLKIFNIVDTFVDIRDQLEKASQFEKIEQFLKQKKHWEERSKQKNMNLYSKKEYVELNQFESNDEETKNPTKKLIFDNDGSAQNLYLTELLERTTKLIDNQVNKAKSPTELISNNAVNNGDSGKSTNETIDTLITQKQQLKNSKTLYNNQFNEPKSTNKILIENEYDPKNKSKFVSLNNKSYNNNNNDKECNLKRSSSLNKSEGIQNKVYEHLKNDAYRFPLVNEEENPFDFYEKIETGQIFNDNSPSKMAKDNKNENRFINFDSLEKITKVINPYDTNMIFQDSQYVLINNLENFTMNSKKLIQNMQRKSRIIYKLGRKALLKQNQSASSSIILNENNKLLPNLTTSTALLSQQKHNNDKKSSCDSSLIDDSKPKKRNTNILFKSRRSSDNNTTTNNNNNSFEPINKQSIVVDSPMSNSLITPKINGIIKRPETQDFDFMSLSSKLNSRTPGTSSSINTKSFFNTYTKFDDNSKVSSFDGTKSYNLKNELCENRNKENSGNIQPNSITSKMLETSQSKLRKTLNNGQFSDKLLENKSLYKLRSTSSNRAASFHNLPFSPMVNDQQQHNISLEMDEIPQEINKTKRKIRMAKEIGSLNQLLDHINQVSKQSRLEIKEFKKHKIEMNQDFQKSTKNANKGTYGVLNANAPDNITNSKHNLVRLQKLLSVAAHTNH